MAKTITLNLVLAPLLALLAAACAAGNDTNLPDVVQDQPPEGGEDLLTDGGDGDAGESEGAEDPLPDEGAGDALQDQEGDPAEEDAAAEDLPAEESADPCDPNPCTEEHADECADSATLLQYPAAGTCTPTGSSYTCDYFPVSVDCSATSSQVCLEGACTNTIAQVRAAPDGPVAFSLRGVYVTYVKPATSSGNGFYIQKERTGPGLFMVTGSAAPSVAAGNLIDVTITSVTQQSGMKQASAFTVATNDRVARDVGFLVQDFSSGGAIDEDTESELIRITSARIVSGWIEQYRVAFGASSLTDVRYTGFATLTPRVCPGMVIGILAPAGEYDGAYRLTPFAAADFTSLDASGCGAIDDSNWNFEDWTYADPPEDFEKRTEFFAATEENGIVDNGSAGARLTWTSTDNQDFYQAWYTPAVIGTPCTFHLWVYDNDTGGRSRLAVTPYDASKSPLTNDYSTTFSSDSTSWRELVHTFTPASAGFIRPFLRLYDVTGWPGSASLIIDDWALTLHTAFNVSDGYLDSWTATDPAIPWLVAGTPGLTMVIDAAVNDEGVLYLATNKASPGTSDHFLYAWIGSPAPAATVPAPWSKGGVVAGPGTGSYLVVLIQEESTGYCEILRWNASTTSWASTPAACGSGSGTHVEGSVNLVTVLGIAAVRDIPSTISFAVAPYGTGNGGTVYSASQIPACTACDGNIDAGEAAARHRALLLIGHVK